MAAAGRDKQMMVLACVLRTIQRAQRIAGQHGTCISHDDSRTALLAAEMLLRDKPLSLVEMGELGQDAAMLANIVRTSPVLN